MGGKSWRRSSSGFKSRAVAAARIDPAKIQRLAVTVLIVWVGGSQGCTDEPAPDLHNAGYLYMDALSGPKGLTKRHNYVTLFLRNSSHRMMSNVPDEFSATAFPAKLVSYTTLPEAHSSGLALSQYNRKGLQVTSPAVIDSVEDSWKQNDMGTPFWWGSGILTLPICNLRTSLIHFCLHLMSAYFTPSQNWAKERFAAMFSAKQRGLTKEAVCRRPCCLSLVYQPSCDKIKKSQSTQPSCC